jgi:MarR family
MSRIQQVIETLEAERAEVQKRLQWLERQIKEFRTHNGAAATTPASSPSRTTRARASSRATSSRRTGARPPRTSTSGSPTTATAAAAGSDARSQILAYLREHPGSTATDIAKGTGLKRNSTSTRLTQMAKAGEITKQSRGYAAS